ncbi:Cytochrome c-type biogenesis protein CcmE [Galdieria sulphuraria]|nr:Cytochrome c-type biogenesis protein CcmE [Galdieria sulphuraria]
MFRRLLLPSAKTYTLWKHSSKSHETNLKTAVYHLSSFVSSNSKKALNNESNLDSFFVGTWKRYSFYFQKQRDFNCVQPDLFSENRKFVYGRLESMRHFSEQIGSDKPSRFATGSSLGSSSSAADSKIDWRVRVRRAQRKRLYYLVGGMAVFATLVYSALFAFEDRLMYFLTPTQTLAKVATLRPESRFRLGGVVVNGSFMLNEKEKFAEFVVTDLENEIPVLFKGDTFPDLFGEGKSVVAEGYLRDGIFYADKILAKHDEYYIPKSVQESINRNPVSVYGALKSANVGSRNY